MTYQKRLKAAINLLKEVAIHTDRERGANIVFYPDTLPALSEIVSELEKIELFD